MTTFSKRRKNGVLKNNSLQSEFVEVQGLIAVSKERKP